MRDFARDDSAWADFLISKAALILASVVFFAALFNLIASFKGLETREKLDFLALDFKTAVDEVGSSNSQVETQQGFQEKFQSGSQDEFRESSYCFSEQEIFRDLPFAGDIKVRVSGEYVCLEAESGERSFRAVKPFAFRVLPLDESILHEKLSEEFGAPGNEEIPLTADYSEIRAFLQALGAEEAVLNPNENISLKKEFIYMKDEEGVSAFGCVLVYQ
ncbi:hypothetical protein MSKOL_0738 [Methanosarcina sp. Kolksee]|uniref:hypothetical protein n=1 Tax=Methanosarcina sp. Kolksee TaxID=1434099 RepID=UPI000615FCCD|nr:hypothetical protein [Methanosarcina sp. Kolksee]AKB46515.1 hypothetical protein MSKOL_0738 [Methanosarcina sp. Kolksee]